ncbi:MAG: tetratricopeptide repeat protein [Balneolales bacterium]
MRFKRLSIFIAGIAWLITSILAGCETSQLHRYDHYMNVKDYSAAKKLIQEKIQENPYNQESHLLLGEVHLELREYEEARSAFNNSRYTSSEYTNRVQLLSEKYYRKEYKAGVQAMQKENYKESLINFMKAAEVDPERHEIYPALGFSFFNLGNYDKAYDSYLQATVLDGSDANSFHALSELAFRQGKISEAADYALQAADIDNDHLAAHEMLVYTGVKLEEYEHAELAFQAIPENQRSFKLSKDYAFALFNQGKYESVRPHLESLDKLYPDNESILQALAETYHHLNQYEDMANIYEALWQKNPEDVDVLVNLIEAYDMTGDKNKADKFKERLQEVNSNS